MSQVAWLSEIDRYGQKVGEPDMTWKISSAQTLDETAYFGGAFISF